MSNVAPLNCISQIIAVEAAKLEVWVNFTVRRKYFGAAPCLREGQGEHWVVRIVVSLPLNISHLLLSS